MAFLTSLEIIDGTTDHLFTEIISPITHCALCRVARLTIPSPIHAQTPYTPALQKQAAEIVFKIPAFHKAIKAYTEQDLNSAKKQFLALLRRFPENPIILNNLAVIAHEHNQNELAIKYLKDAIASNHILNLSYQNLSAIYSYQAAQAYRQALGLDIKNSKLPQLSIIDPKTLPTAPKILAVASELLKEKHLMSH